MSAQLVAAANALQRSGVVPEASVHAIKLFVRVRAWPQLKTMVPTVKVWFPTPAGVTSPDLTVMAPTQTKMLPDIPFIEVPVLNVPHRAKAVRRDLVPL